MKIFVKITVSLIVGVLVGLLYSYENPDHKYYVYLDGHRKEIRYDEYQIFKKSNQKTIGYQYIPINRYDVINSTRVMLIGGLSFIGMVLVMQLFQGIEDRLKRVGHA